MSKVTNAIDSIIAADTTLVTSTVTVLTQVINMQEVLSGRLQVKFKASTAPGTGKIIHFYLLHSLDNVTFDEADLTGMEEIGNFSMPNDTNDHVRSIPLDGVAGTGMFAKLAVMCDAASNYGVLRSAAILRRKAN
jgi:hypothetical protein